MPSNEPDFLACSFLNIEPGKPVRYLQSGSKSMVDRDFCLHR